MNQATMKQLAEWLVDAKYCRDGELWYGVLIGTPDSELNDAEYRAKWSQMWALIQFIKREDKCRALWKRTKVFARDEGNLEPEVYEVCILRCAEAATQ